MKLFLAPMAGITDWPFRLLCFENGCDFATTEMVSAQGYLTAPKERQAYRFLIARAPYEGPLLAQIFGHEPVHLARAAQELTDTGRFVGIDINMGCPAQKVTGSGSGSALLRDEKQVANIVRAVSRATLLPVSVKIRLGWDDQTKNAEQIAQIAQEEGAAQLTVHGRTRMQQYSGKADWEAIARVKQAVSIPVIANGDVVDGQSARDILRVTGCDGIAIGRGALGNPWLFAQVKAALNQTPYELPPLEVVTETAKRHARMMIAWKGERSALLEMRKHFAWYIHGRRGAAQLRTRLNTAESFAQVFDLFDEFARHDG